MPSLIGECWEENFSLCPSRDFPLTMANQNREFLFIRISPTKKKGEKHEKRKKQILNISCINKSQDGITWDDHELDENANNYVEISLNGMKNYVPGRKSVYIGNSIRTKKEKKKLTSQNGQTKYVTSLEERISKLVAENIKIKIKYTEVVTENADIKAENIKLKRDKEEIPKLRREIAEFKKKYTEIETECTKLKQIIEDSYRREVEHVKLKEDTTNLKAKNAEFKARIAKIEQKHLRNNAVDRLEDVNTKKGSRSPIETISSEEKKINDFLDRVHKETISVKIREKNWEKKLISQDSTSSNDSEIRNVASSTEQK
ncbi:8231_t:CDS:2 [Diversispora eburnea]|uniref:8231_t:CDS:1 n=1 Tax=Diversispora eburnea TaxID=1213867 RepID=A0A9N8WJS0_9GLOM|nr:8231_t:CDS:2 [Diversispora eburnea]